MKISLINPHPSKYPPLGLVSIAPYLIEQGHEVTIHEGVKNLFVPSYNTDLVGITGLSLWGNEIKHAIREVWNHIPIVVGGPCITSNPSFLNELTEQVRNVFGVVGEGEVTICELADALEREKPIDGIKGLRYRQKDTPDWTWNPFCPRPFMSLEEKKIPSWNLLPSLKYSIGLGVETSRGCPFNCIWCSAPLISGRKWRAREPSEVVWEIETLQYKYQVKRVYFADDNCTANPKRWVQLCKLLAFNFQGEIEFHVPEGIQAHHLNKSTLKLMQTAGFDSITVGAESGVQRVLDDVIGKYGLTPEKVEQVVKDCVEIGLQVSCFFVIGTYGETLDEVKQTLSFAEHLRKLGADSCSIRNALPIPNTRMWNLAEKNGDLLITEEDAYNHKLLHSGRHFMNSPEWDHQDIEIFTDIGHSQNQWHLIKRHPLLPIKTLFKKIMYRFQS